MNRGHKQRRQPSQNQYPGRHRPLDNTTQQRVILALMTISLVLGAIFAGRGLFLLGFSAEKPDDLALRWRELQYIERGQNPYDISEHLYKIELGLPTDPKSIVIDGKLGGTSVASGYPPWAFFWSFLFIPPLAWPVARIWFFISNLTALGVIACFAWRCPLEKSLLHRCFTVASVFSVNAVGTTLGNGQWGLVLCALLILFSYQIERGKKILPALFYAIALLKPTSTFAHVTMLFARKSWVPFLIAGLLTVAASAIVGWHVGSNPFGMLLQMLDQTSRWKDISYSIPDALLHTGLPRGLVMAGCLVAALILSYVLLRLRPTDPLHGLAVCGTLARLLTYHQLYDNVLLLFLVLAIARMFLADRKCSSLAVLCLLLVSVWIPGRFTGNLIIQAFQMTVWAASLGWPGLHHRHAPFIHSDDPGPSRITC